MLPEDRLPCRFIFLQKEMNKVSAKTTIHVF